MTRHYSADDCERDEANATDNRRDAAMSTQDTVNRLVELLERIEDDLTTGRLQHQDGSQEALAEVRAVLAAVNQEARRG